ncbi:hypothetical protein SAMN05216390_10264 [Lachnospiraceae bacterium KH1T2]|nr:hypothetical protein SAMN05216390_10264 [Lachnospiraceae bacterium KH1T2]
MIQLIVGEKGKGKTKILLDRVNEAAKNAKGNISFVDKDLSHMYDLKNSIRLVNVSDYSVSDADEFVGFVSGIISADHDLEELFIDRFLKVSSQDSVSNSLDSLRKLDTISSKFNVKITVSLSGNKDELSGDLQDKVVVEL